MSLGGNPAVSESQPIAAPAAEKRWKGFTRKQLEAFGIRSTAAGMEIPYFTREGQHYRTKLFPWSGEPRSRWLGASKPQIPFALQRLALGGGALIVTEGESCTIAASLAFPTVPVIGLPGSRSWKPNWATHFEGFERIYLSFDADTAGLALLDRVKADVPNYRMIDLPKGADTRDLLQRLGADAYRVLVDVADRGFDQRQAWSALHQAVQRRRQLVELPWQEAA